MHRLVITFLFMAAAVVSDVVVAEEGLSAGASGPAAPLRFRLPGDAVVYRGVTNFDAAGLDDRQMMYVGGPIGLVAGVIVHAVITEKRRQNQKAELQDRADAVIAPYADAVARFSQRELLERSFVAMKTVGDKHVDSATRSEEGWIIGYSPVFAMHLDRRAIVLDNVVTLSRTRSTADVPVSITIRVVSSAQPGDDPESYWAVDEAARLKDESAALLAISLDTALSEMRRSEPSSTVPVVQRTLRYRLGNEERMERAELLAQTCDRIVMRTLRGWILSAPTSRTPLGESGGRACAPAPGS